MGTRERRREEVNRQSTEHDEVEGHMFNRARNRIAGLQQDARDLLDLARPLVNDLISGESEDYLDTVVQESGQ
jgi:hypothetical protein